MMKKTLYLLIAFALFQFSVIGQEKDRFEALATTLRKMESEQPGLTEEVNFSLTDASIQEFLRGVATAHNLNISIDPNLNIFVDNNFTNAKVSDVLLFLCKQYNLEIKFVGSIMSFNKYVAPPVKIVRPSKKLGITYAEQTNFLSLDLKRDTLSNVVKEITKLSGRNVVLAPGIENELVSVYIQNRPFENALDKMAYANNLAVTSTDDNFFLLERKTAVNQEQATNNRGSRNTSRSNNNSRQSTGGMDLTVQDGLITVQATDFPIVDAIKAVSGELIKNFFLFSEPSGNTTVYMEGASYEEFLTYLLNGTDYTYKKENEVYLIGERSIERLRLTEMVQLQNRTVETVVDYIPDEIKKGVEIKEFLELNSLVLSGSYPQIQEIKQFIRSVDLVVPVVMIDVMIVDVSKKRGARSGISMGVGENPDEAAGTGTILPNFNFKLGTGSIGDLIKLFNGYGLVNLGKVNSNFYLNIDALETEGIVRKRSTPKLSTLNGHEASLTIGETQYYAITQSNLIGTQNPTISNSIRYEPNNADMEVKIKPMVSGDDQVTLDITVSQSDFSGEADPGAPRGTVSMGFDSQIRVRNEEMIMLGGLETKNTSNSGSGVPFLSRIPVIKWFFSRKSFDSENAKMHIFIKPTIIY